ncbi:hypothetical protein [Pseudomonas phage PA1C]|nr:hypothetical protein [Pseudomonas phage PA1C]BEG72431.1 hypothetical protein RVBP21_0590 [Pseudomonas phage BRkr]
MATMCVSWPEIITMDLSGAGAGGETVSNRKDILSSTLILTGGTFDGKDKANGNYNDAFIFYLDTPDMPADQRVRFKVFNHSERSIIFNVPERWLGKRNGIQLVIQPGNGVEILRVVWIDEDTPIIRWIMRGPHYEFNNM